MMKKISSILSLLLSVCILLYLNNCSCIFTLSAGLAGTKEEPQRTFIMQSLKTENIKLGTQVIINLKDGTTVKGKYLGTDTIPNENFDEEYAELQKQMPEGIFLPGEGDTITVISEFVHENPVKFLRFGYGNILLGGIDYDYGVRVRLGDLQKIVDKHGREIEGAEIQKLISEGKFPPLFLSVVIVEEYIPNEDGSPDFDTRKRFININDLEDIQREPSKSDIIQSLKTENIKLGSQAIITLKDGTIVRGKYAGIESLPNEEYTEKYDEFLTGISIEEYTGEEDRYGHEITNKKFIDFNDIDQIQIKPKKPSISDGFFSGCLIDVVTIALLYFL